mmetsp:Transcript_45929/g.84243  ORF Transcript_45929/g.84243 Transcript_45929/m.84243 type:complete len:386 (+) Transcript_45929:172-1329(+)
MDIDPATQRQALLDSCPESTALRTHHLLILARLVFAFAHGALVASASLALASSDASWWAIFLPVWLGNLACIAIIVLSWFASCSYIQKCLEERQARYGEENPSILTELLPEIVLSILGLVFVIITLIGEILLCWHLAAEQRGHESSLGVSAAVLMFSGFLAVLHGVCVRSNGELFICAGGGVFLTFAFAVAIPDGFAGDHSWVILLPAVCSVAGISAASAKRLRSYTAADLLNPEERTLRAAELFVLLTVLLALLVAVAGLALSSTGEPAGISYAAAALSGAGLCLIAFLRGRMVYIETRLEPPIRERLILCHARACMANHEDEDQDSMRAASEPQFQGLGYLNLGRSSSAGMTPTPSAGTPIRRTRSALADEMEAAEPEASSKG